MEFFLFFRLFKRCYFDAKEFLSASLSMLFLLVMLLYGAVTSVIAGPLPEGFTISDIRVDGLKRVSAGTIFSDFPISAGETINSERLVSATKSLFTTGLFTDIQLYREGRDLVIKVEERPSITKIDISGNKDISEDDLRDGLKKAGLSEGSVFKRVTLERLELEILRSYVAQGRYSASVESEVVELPRNRVGINLTIDEGEVASILHINIVGNHDFSDEKLINLMELRMPSFWSTFTSDDKYSKEKLSGDLERIRSFYLDDGYIKFAIESTQVSISPYKEDVFITINISEGPQFTVKDFDLKGDLVLEKEVLEKLIMIKEGDVFSRNKITLTSDLISRALGSEGYTYANVNAIPETHDDNTASVIFFVDPGKRNYVRRINFRGNTNTRDEVLRQEMLQMEGASASTDLIEASKSRLERLGFFGNVTVDTPSVPGSSDQIDVNYTVEEQSSGNLSASLGFSQGSGFSLGLSVSENNFFGSGKRVSFGVNTTSSVKSANFSYLDPYFTVDGVSRGFSVFARKTDFDEDDLSDYIIDETGASVTFGYPINNISRLQFTFGYTNTSLTVGPEVAKEIGRFSDVYGNKFDTFFVSPSWSRSTLNRGQFPTKGWGQNLTLEVSTPFSDLSFYKLNYRSNSYFPLDDNHSYVFRIRNEWSWGDGYGDTKQLPFYEHYFSGGIGSVRGFERNSLGIQTQVDTGRLSDPYGGNLLFENSAELIFPVPFVEDQRSLRLSYFLDSGNVFNTFSGFDFDPRELRFSTGVSLQWITFIGPLGFSFGKAINDVEKDDKQFFQFSLGQPF
ncbi:MAG: outer membrane protein insertion porin family [Oleiphilaceae bacterium]|jgi:outer membrane protein insertion porin family